MCVRELMCSDKSRAFLRLEVEGRYRETCASKRIKNENYMGLRLYFPQTCTPRTTEPTSTLIEDTQMQYHG